MGLDLLKAPIEDVKKAAADLEGKSADDLKDIIAALLASVQTLESQAAVDAGKIVAQVLEGIKSLFPFTISSGGK